MRWTKAQLDQQAAVDASLMADADNPLPADRIATMAIDRYSGLNRGAAGLPLPTPEPKDAPRLGGNDAPVGVDSNTLDGAKMTATDSAKHHGTPLFDKLKAQFDAAQAEKDRDMFIKIAPNRNQGARG
jgi:hypothetical protein